MSVTVITGSAGLIGSEAAAFFSGLGLDVIGIDNDMRREFFGDEASTRWNRDRLARELGSSYIHLDLDIRDSEGIEKTFAEAFAAIVVPACPSLELKSEGVVDAVLENNLT